jgi:mono/diheme cytochrome c family protein
VQPRLTPLTRWSLWLVAAGACALGAATAAGACTPAPDTIDLGTGGSGSGSGGGANGSGSGGAAANHGKELFAALQDDLYKACGSCHDAGGIADTPFLAGPDVYATISSWPGIVVKDPKESQLLTYPIAGPLHTYKKIDSDEYKDTLYPALEAWLTEEAKNIVTTMAADAGKSIPPFAPIIGFNAVYLDALGDAYTGMALTFNALQLDEHVIELDDLEVHPTAALGVHLVHPLFSVFPLGKESDPDPVDSLSNVDQVFDSGQAGALGPGTLILTNWQAGAKLAVAFQKIEPFTTQVGDGGTEGGTTGGCKDVTSFNDNAAVLLAQNCQGCHGGGNGQAKGAVDMSQLTADPAAACSQIKNRVDTASAAQSQLFITTDPGGNAAHPFKFGGDNGKFDAFKQSVSQWISAEK